MFKRSSLAQSVLLVDIASSSVGVGLSGTSEGSLPTLAFTVRIPFSHREDSNLSLIDKAMLHALRDALGVAFREGVPLLQKKGFPSSINHSVISFTSPWYISRLGGTAEDFAQSFERRYNTTAEIFSRDTHYHSAIEKDLVHKIEEEIIRAFGIKEGIALENFTVAFSKVVDHAFEGLDPAMFVDLTGHTTDILSRKDKRYVGSYSIPIGTHKLKTVSDWEKEWGSIIAEHDAEFRTGNIFLVSDGAELGKRLLLSVFPRARVIPFDHKNGFIKEMVITDTNTPSNERLAILATYTNLFF